MTPACFVGCALLAALAFAFGQLLGNYQALRALDRAIAAYEDAIAEREEAIEAWEAAIAVHEGRIRPFTGPQGPRGPATPSPASQE